MNVDKYDPIWPFFISLDTIPGLGKRVKLTAEENTRNAMAELGNLYKIDRFSAELEIHVKGRKPVYTVSGLWQADFFYRSVRTLEPFYAQLEGTFKERFKRDIDHSKQPETFSSMDDDPPLAIPDQGLPIGDLLVELFMLELDPYPHDENDPPNEWIEDLGNETPEQNDELLQKTPFAKLAHLKQKL